MHTFPSGSSRKKIVILVRVGAETSDYNEEDIGLTGQILPCFPETSSFHKHFCLLVYWQTPAPPQDVLMSKTCLNSFLKLLPAFLFFSTGSLLFSFLWKNVSSIWMPPICFYSWFELYHLVDLRFSLQFPHVFHKHFFFSFTSVWFRESCPLFLQPSLDSQIYGNGQGCTFLSTCYCFCLERDLLIGATTHP